MISDEFLVAISLEIDSDISVTEDRDSADLLLKNFSTKHITKVEGNLSRRDFFRKFTVPIFEPPNITPKTKDITYKRRLLLKNTTKLKPLEENNIIPLPTFISDKYINNNCNNCSLCYRICPSNALYSDERNSKIYFEPHLCLKCHLCHDVCEVDAILLKDTFDINYLISPVKKELFKHTIKRCSECGGLFTYTSGEMICNRCRDLENEAMELSGLW
jgi:ferredoxin